MPRIVVPAAALAAALIALLATPAAALPFGGPLAAPTPVTQIFDGCGPYGHRGPLGRCRPGGQAGGYNARACPPGWHIGPYGRRCWPNRY